jgi:iron(III) transport system ATP-binding protein
VTPPPRLALQDVCKRFDELEAVRDAAFEVAGGEVVCLLGPSGCGKSTLLRIAAGVERQSSGEVLVDGRIVSDAQRHDPPESRSVGLMFQDFALFPHLTVADNVAFGLKRSLNGTRSRIVGEYLERVGLSGYEKKYPHQLSGGEQQRVALARALAPKPRVMLMDEPFSGLDQRLRDDIRDETLAVLKEEGTAVLMVTHEPAEAMRMADRVALMRAGRIVQIGAPYHIYNHPVDRKAAAFFSDLNVIHGEVRARQTDTPFGLFLTPGMVDQADVEIIIRPQHLKIDEDSGKAPPATARNGLPARGVVVRSRFMGSDSLIEVRMDHDGSLLKATVPGAYLPPPGKPLWLSLRREHCFVFPCERQSRVVNPWEADRDLRGRRPG